jgi:endonuclease YncB( thermonuclease family)
MQKFFRFWKKDFTNKLIVLVVLLIASALAVDLFLLTMPKSSGTSLLADLFPTPTTDRKVIFTQVAKTVVYQAAMATASVPPTITTMPFTPKPRTPTSTPTPVTPSPTAAVPASTLQALGTVVDAGTAGPTQTLTSAPGLACIPNTPAQTGKVVDTLDGITIKVLIDGLVYSVRYIGIELPETAHFALLSSSYNGSMVFGKEISLIADGPDKDQLGRLLRYVKVDETFVNLELLRQGLATMGNIDPPFSCVEVFKNAEQSSRDEHRGLWNNTPTP